jgi:hypothetical protein
MIKRAETKRNERDAVDANKVVPVLVSIAIIVLVSVVKEKSRFLVAVLTSMPVLMPMALWVVWSASKGNHEQTAEFAGSLVLGVAATLAFVTGTWIALRQNLDFGWRLGAGAIAWLVVLGGGKLLQGFWP